MRLRWGRPLVGPAVAVGAALAVVALWFARVPPPVAESALVSTNALRITRHEAIGLPSTPVSIRDPALVRAIVEALAVDTHPAVACPSDYASADVGIVLMGRDVYARRNVYVWGLAHPDASVLVVTSSGCRSGPPADVAVLRGELDAAFARADAGH